MLASLGTFRAQTFGAGTFGARSEVVALFPAGGVTVQRAGFRAYAEGEAPRTRLATAGRIGSPGIHAGASALFSGLVGVSSVPQPRVRATGRAAVQRLPSFAIVGRVEPQSWGFTPLVSLRGRGSAGRVEPDGGAQAPCPSLGAAAEIGSAYPHGVRNPTDEELAVMVWQAVRQRRH